MGDLSFVQVIFEIYVYSNSVSLSVYFPVAVIQEARKVFK